jgi:hypothetical protein
VISLEEAERIANDAEVIVAYEGIADAAQEWKLKRQILGALARGEITRERGLAQLERFAARHDSHVC